MSKKSIIFLTGVCICILGVSVPAMAETTSRRANIKSSGNLDFDNGTVYFTSSDLTYLADEIDNLEDTYKQTSVDALNDVGTFFLSDGTIVNDREQNEVDTDEKKSALSFGSILEGIKKSQSIDSLSQTQVLDKDGNPLFYETEEAQTNKNIHSLTTTDTGFPAFYQPANANNLSAGTAAWVDGTLIKGNGSDNAAYEELYIYHSHATDVSKNMEFNTKEEAKSYFENNPMPETQATKGGCYQVEAFHYSITTVEKTPVYHYNAGNYNGMAYCLNCDGFVANQSSNICYYKTHTYTNYYTDTEVPDDGTLLGTIYSTDCGYRHGELIDIVQISSPK